MIILLNKRVVVFMFTGIFLLSALLGTYNVALHPNMKEWVDNKIVITRVNTSQKVIAFTFDDGPDPVNTPLIMDALKKHHAQATFFVLGSKAEKQQQLIKQMDKDGYEIGNHSYSHSDFNHKDRAFITDQINKTNELILGLTGRKPVLFRPPGGYLSHELVDITNELKVTIAYWTYQQDSKDWKGANANNITNHILKNIAPGQVIILHDGCDNGAQTAKALDKLLDCLSKDGYRFVTMSELIKLDNKE